jgi:hypothetical protein
MSWPWITNRRQAPQILPPAPKALPAPTRIFRTIEAMKEKVRLLGSNPIEIAQAALAADEQRIIELETERAQKLEDADADGDYLTEIDALDRQIRTLRANASVHRDRIAAMEIKAAKRERARIAEQRTAAIDKIKTALPARVTAAERLDVALKEVAGAFNALAVADAAVFANWSALLPPMQGLAYLSALRIGELSVVRRQRMTAGAVRHLVERVPLEIAAETAKRNLELLEELTGIGQRPAETAESEDTAA